MNIKRFNESEVYLPYPHNSIGDRSTNFFKDSKLSEYFDEQNKFLKIKGDMLNLINEYVDLNDENRDYFLEEYELQPGDIIDFSVELINSEPYKRLALKLIKEGNINYMRNVDFKKMVEFINNPEMFRNQKKFNL